MTKVTASLAAGQGAPGRSSPRTPEAQSPQMKGDGEGREEGAHHPLAPRAPSPGQTDRSPRAEQPGGGGQGSSASLSAPCWMTPRGHLCPIGPRLPCKAPVGFILLLTAVDSCLSLARNRPLLLRLLLCSVPVWERTGDPSFYHPEASLNDRRRRCLGLNPLSNISSLCGLGQVT